MLGWAMTFLVIAIIAAILGFTGIAGTAAGIAQVLFVVFVVLFLVSLLMGVHGRRYSAVCHPDRGWRSKTESRRVANT